MFSVYEKLSFLLKKNSTHVYANGYTPVFIKVCRYFSLIKAILRNEAPDLRSSYIINGDVVINGYIYKFHVWKCLNEIIRRIVLNFSQSRMAPASW